MVGIIKDLVVTGIAIVILPLMYLFFLVLGTIASAWATMVRWVGGYGGRGGSQD